MSAWAPAHTLKPSWRALRFIGSAERRLAKPECISPQTARQWARAAGSAGSRPASGLISFRYSPIARVSQTLTLSCSRQGTRKEGDSSKSSARVAGSSIGATRSAKSSPAILHSNQPRSDQEE